MKRILLLSFLLVVTPLFTRAEEPASAPASYDALVMLHVDGLDDAKLARLSAIIGREESLTLEYSCVWGDGLVLHVEDISFSEKAHVITYLQRYLREAGISTGVEFLYVHVEAQGPGKC